MILILILAPPTLGARGHLPHLPSPSYATVWMHVSVCLSLPVSVCPSLSCLPVFFVSVSGSVYLFLCLSLSLCLFLSTPRKPEFDDEDSFSSFDFAWLCTFRCVLKNTFAFQFALAIRGGQKLNLHAEELVIGDLVEVRFGDLVPADIRVVQAHGFKVLIYFQFWTSIYELHILFFFILFCSFLDSIIQFLYTIFSFYIPYSMFTLHIQFLTFYTPCSA